MIKLICSQCGQVWYTANTQPDQKCTNCGGKLVEEDTLIKTAQDKKVTILQKKAL